MDSNTPIEKPEPGAFSTENNTPGASSPSNQANQGSPQMDDIGIYALARILCDMNPYTGVKDDTTGETTLSMVVGTPQASDCLPVCQSALQQLDKCIEDRIPSINVEVERNYGTTWNFKGQPATIKTAFRVPYTFTVKKNDRLVWQQTEHLLIGFAGAAGGG